MTSLWKHLTGVSLAGQYRLEQFLGGDESAAWYLTMSRSGERAAIKLIPEDRAAAHQLSAWRATRLLSHSNLLPMFDCGIAETEDGKVLFAVFEYPDDNLAAALGGKPLDEADARETLAACLEGLRYLHGRGMVHGAVDEQHIVAVGERIKLATDTLRPADAADSSAEGDIRRLHETLGIPYSAPPQPAPQVPIGQPRAEPRQELLPEPRREREEEVPEHGMRTLPNWAFGAAAALVVMIGLMFALKPAAKPKPAAPPPQPQQTAPAPAAVPAENPARSVPAAIEDPAPPASQGRAMWRVVAYTYNHYRDADKKARSINARWPGLHASVFTPKGKNRPPYFVALGGRMTHSEALNLRHVAQAKGLPRDTFVRNYSD